MTQRIFLSHSHKDNAWCDEFVNELSKYDVDIWYDRQSLDAGARWVRTIGEELANRDLFLIILTPDSWKSEWVREELDLAFAAKKPIIALILKQTQPDGFILLRQMINIVGKDISEAATIIAQNLKLTIIKEPEAEDGERLEKHQVGRNIFNFKNRNLRDWRVLVSVVVLLALALSLIPFLRLPTCFAPFCPSSQPSTNQQSPQNVGEVQDQNLSMTLVDVVSPSFVLSNDSQSQTTNNTSPKSISAVSLAKNTSTYDKIIVDVKNMRAAGVDILINYIALKLLSIPAVPRPLKVWTPGVSTTYIAYPYPVTYKGQTPGQLLYAEPPQNVILKPGETDQLSIQVISTVTAYLQFQVQISYQIANAATAPPLTLPQTFQVVFSDASNW